MEERFGTYSVVEKPDESKTGFKVFDPTNE
jgi:hypothetical protein